MNGFIPSARTAAGKGMECMMCLKGYQSPQGGFGKTMVALKSGRTPSVTFQRKSEKRESKSNCKLPVECVWIWYSSPQGFKIICKLKTIFRKTVKLVRTSGSTQTFTKPSVMSLNSHTHTHTKDGKQMHGLSCFLPLWAWTCYKSTCSYRPTNTILPFFLV